MFFKTTKGKVLFVFPVHAGLKGWNEAKVLAILEPLRKHSHSFHNKEIEESDSANAIS